MLNLLGLSLGENFTELKGLFAGKSSGHTFDIAVVNIQKSKIKCAFSAGLCPIFS